MIFMVQGLVVVAGLLIGLAGPVLAHEEDEIFRTTTTATPISSPLSTTSPSPSPSPEVSAPPVDVTAADLGVPEPSGWQTFKRKFVRFFTRNQVKRQQLNLELANLTLLRAHQAAQTGDTDRAASLVSSYNTQISQVSGAVGDLLTRLPTDPAAQALVDRLTQTQVLQIELLDSLTVKADQKFNTEILKTRLEVTRKLADVLTKEDLSPDELAEKLANLEAKLTEKETKAEGKLFRQLHLLEDLGEVADNPELRDELEGRAREHVGNAAQSLPPETLGQIVRSIPGDIWKHIAVLHSVLDQVPPHVRSTLEKVIEDELDKLADRLKERAEGLDDALKEAEDDDVLEAQKKLAEQLRKRAEKDQELAEKLAKKAQKIQEKLEKARQKALEEAVEADEDEADEDEQHPSPLPSPTSSTTTKTATSSPTKTTDDDGATSPSSSPTATASPTATPSPTSTKLEVEIDISNFAFSRSLTLTKGQRTKLRVRNQDSVNHTLTISQLGVSTGTIKPSEDEDLEFTPATSGTFKISCDFHSSMSGSATVN